MYQKLKAQAGKLNELWTVVLIFFGLPAVFYVYFDWKAALAVFVISQIVLGFVREIVGDEE